MKMTSFIGRRVLVTGAGGFIGSHLVETLIRKGAEVRAFIRYNSRNDSGLLERVPPDSLAEVEVVPGDIRNGEAVAAAVDGCEVVFHLAALIAIPYSYRNPREYFETNVLGTLNIAQACRGRDVRLIHTSTSEVYGTARTVPISETHPVVGQSPYSASKIGADHLVESFHRSYGLPTTIVRPFNTYGPRQSARAIIPTIAAQALAGDVLHLGALAPTRDFTYVDDVVAGFLAAARTDAAIGRTLQLGTGEEISIGDLVHAVERVLGRDLRVERAEERLRPAESEVMRLVSDHSQMTAVTGWEPRVDFHTGLAATVAWIDEHSDLYRVDRYVV
jgi:NAD dependent epimerase/dehydratase